MAQVQNLSEWRGQTLVDRDGDKIGKLEEIYVDTSNDQPQFGSVKQGALGRKLTFVPLVDATVGRDEIQISFSKEQVKEAPNMDPSGELSIDDETALYQHYGLPYAPAPTESGRRLARR